MAHAQKPDLVFQRNGRVHLNRRWSQFSRLLAVEECGSTDRNCIDRVPTYRARLLATLSIRIFPLHFPSRASPCAIRFWTRYIQTVTVYVELTKSGQIIGCVGFNAASCNAPRAHSHSNSLSLFSSHVAKSRQNHIFKTFNKNHVLRNF